MSKMEAPTPKKASQGISEVPPDNPLQEHVPKAGKASKLDTFQWIGIPATLNFT